MPKDKRSFFERLTGAIRLSDEDEALQDENEESENETKKIAGSPETDSDEGELSVDVYQSSNEIVIKTMVAGVRPEDLDIAITRDMVTVRGKREGERSIKDEDYFHKELYWGTFSRTILLPCEVEIEDAEAVEKHGLLIIRLPKLDKHRQSKLKVRANN